MTDPRVDRMLTDAVAADHLLVHLKVLASEAIPAEMLTGPDPLPAWAGVRVGGVALEMNCPPPLAVELLRRTADAIERDYLAEVAQTN